MKDLKKEKKQRLVKNDFNVVEINGLKFVAGLEWVSLNSPLNFMREAREYGKKNNKSIVAIRKNKLIQAGFVPKESSAKKGMYSLAVALATAIKEDFVGAFDLEDGSNRYVVVAALKGEVVALGDVIGDAFFAESTLQQIINLYSSSSEAHVFKEFYAPKSFDLFDDELKLSDILTKESVGKEARLKQLHFGLSGAEVRSIVIFLIFCLGAFYYWSGEQDKKKALAALIAEQRAAELERLKEVANQDYLEIEELDKPWVLQPSAKSTLEKCEGIISEKPLVVGGWIFDSALCNQSGKVETRYRRTEYLSIKDLQQAAKSLNWVSPIVHFPGDGASFVGDFDVAAVGSDKLEEKNHFFNYFISYFQKIGVEPNINEVAHELRYDNNGNLLPSPDWAHYRFSLENKMSPVDILLDLPMKGVRIDSISAGMSADYSLTWRVEGSFYVVR